MLNDSSTTQNKEAEKVEDSLRDFIGRVFRFWAKNQDHYPIWEIQIAERETWQIRETNNRRGDPAGSFRGNERYVRRTHGRTVQVRYEVKKGTISQIN